MLNKLSVVIPTYKRKSELIRAVKSVFQSINDSIMGWSFEVIVCDDDPDSHMASLLTEFDIIYIKNKKNLGQIANWNRCIECASGNWVMLLHDDDYILPHCLKTVCEKLVKEPSIDALFTVPLNERSESHKNNPLIKCRKLYKSYNEGTLTKLTLKDYIYDLGYNAPIASVYRKSKIVEMGMFREENFPVADLILHSEFAQYSNTFVLSVPCCVRGLEVSASNDQEIKKQMLIKAFCYRKSMVSTLGIKVPSWWLVTSSWYVANQYYELDSILLVDTLDGRYLKKVYLLTYKIVFFIVGFFKPYYLQTELVIQ